VAIPSQPLNGAPLPIRFVSKNDRKAILSSEAIPTAGTYIVTLKCEGEPFPESHRAPLVVGFKP
jgi:hypothetical protein